MNDRIVRGLKSDLLKVIRLDSEDDPDTPIEEFVSYRALEVIKALESRVQYLELVNANLELQRDAGLRFSGWIKDQACKAGWNPNDPRSDYEVVVERMRALEQENKELRTQKQS